MSRLVRPPPPELISPGDSRTSAPGLLFEDGLLFGSAIGVQLQPPLCREPIFADGLCLCDIGQEFLLECVSHNAELSHVLNLGSWAYSPYRRTAASPAVFSNERWPSPIWTVHRGFKPRRFAFQRALNHLDRLLGSGVFPAARPSGAGCLRRPEAAAP
jgi:hypothetical protein